jgi:hypothetical protein
LSLSPVKNTLELGEQSARSIALVVKTNRFRVIFSRQSLPTDLLNPLTSSFAHISSHPTGDLQDQERNRQKVILLNSLWTWNAFVKEWRSVKLPVGQKLMAEVSFA